MSRRSHLLVAIPASSGLLVLVLCFISMAIRVSDMPRVTVPGESTVKLDGGMYLLYAEGDDDHHDATAQCTVRDSTGTSLHVTERTSGPSYEVLTRQGRAVGALVIAHPGEHVVACTMRDGGHGTVAIGRNVSVTMVIGFAALVAGVIGTLIWFLLSRRRARADQPPPATTGS